MKKFIINDLSQVGEAASWLIKATEGNRLFAFNGEMGVGKTTLIKEICHQLGAEDVVNSPTFAIVNEYESQEGLIMYHFDFYRIDNPEEAYDFGYEEYLYSDNYCFIEWPEKVKELLPENLVNVYIELNDDDSRTLGVHLPLV